MPSVFAGYRQLIDMCFFSEACSLIRMFRSLIIFHLSTVSIEKTFYYVCDCVLFRSLAERYELGSSLCKLIRLLPVFSPLLYWEIQIYE